uniref:NR LBD domain-containing protein n=1 Tax=Meloidogyne hapla TaxID=6305 RepID=A0A1I8BP24_MELHA
MRGGRNKLGVYYKQDRAARSKILQQSNPRTSTSQNSHQQQLMIYANGLNFYENNNSNVSETTVTRPNPYANEAFSGGVKAKRARREAASTYGNTGVHQQHSSKFSSAAYLGGLPKSQQDQIVSNMNSQQHCTSSMTGFDVYLQSPTLSSTSSTNSSANGIFGSSTASTHLSNGDNNGGLAMLLGNSIQPLDEHPETSTSIAPMMMTPLPFHLLHQHQHPITSAHNTHHQLQSSVSNNNNNNIPSVAVLHNVGGKSIGPSSSASSSGVSSSGLNSPPLPIPSSSSFSPISSNKYVSNIHHQLPLVNVKNEIPSNPLPQSLYHQSAVAYTPIMPITTPTLHMTTSLHVTTPLQPYLLHPPHHHHGIINSGGPLTNSHHQSSSGHQQLLPLCQLPPIEGVFYGNHHQQQQTSLSNGNGTVINSGRLLIEDLCLSPHHERPVLVTLQKIQTSNETYSSSLDFCLQVITRHLDTNIIWARQDSHFNCLEPDCRSMQFLNGWAALHLIDFAYALLKGDLSNKQNFQLTEGNMSSIDTSTLALLGCNELINEWNDILQQLRDCQFGKADYVAFKYITLLDVCFYRAPNENPHLAIYHDQVFQIHDQVLHSWLQLRSFSGNPIPLAMSDSLQKFSQLASKCVERLRTRLNQSPDREMPKVPALLDEVLKTDKSIGNGSGTKLVD